jgi:hypothetical protein
MIDPILFNPNQPVRSNKKKTVVIISIALVIVVIVGGISIVRQPKKTETTQVVVTENKEPTPTEKPKIDKKTVKIQVLNGTGTPGQAGTAIEALKKVGYNSDNIKADNAKEFNNTITTVAAKTGFEDTASDIKDSLKTIFDEVNIDSLKLDETSEFDIVVTTGGKIFETSPTATVTPTGDLTPSPTTNVTSSPTPTSSVTPTLTPTPTP